MYRLPLLLFFIGFCDARTSEDLQVTIQDGKIVGRYMTSDSGKTIRAFMGIPYAEPPTGNLRFRAPVTVSKWHGTLRAQHEPPICLQRNQFTRSKEIEGQEDCLYLNVYTPQKPKMGEKYPVMVWFHGDGWMAGHGGISLYGPEYLLEHDVILVTGNYRLGPLGFLSTEDKHCPGNFGLKDQSLILKWVRQNIENFNGDSKSVTIFGESAGGASVNYHMISPMSKGLFDRAISQSGTLMNIWSDTARPGLAKMRAIRLANLLRCPISNTSFKEIIECLRKVPAKDITDALYSFYEWDNDPIVPFPPVIESTQSEEEFFLSAFRFYKHSLDIPWLVGLTSEEGALKTAAFLNNKKKMDDLIKNWNQALPLSLYYDHLPDKMQTEITKKLEEFYFNNEPFLDSNRNNLTHLWSDGWFIGMFENLEHRLKNNLRDNTFVYLFSHKGDASYSEIFGGGAEKFYGTCHADDLIYLFPAHKNTPHFFNSIRSKESKDLTKLMTKLWVNFARTGNPTPEWSSSSEFPLWTPASKFPLNYMRIGNLNGQSDKLLEMDKDLIPERVAFWKALKKESQYWINQNIRDEL